MGRTVPPVTRETRLTHLDFFINPFHRHPHLVHNAGAAVDATTHLHCVCACGRAWISGPKRSHGERQTMELIGRCGKVAHKQAHRQNHYERLMTGAARARTRAHTHTQTTRQPGTQTGGRGKHKVHNNYYAKSLHTRKHVSAHLAHPAASLNFLALRALRWGHTNSLHLRVKANDELRGPLRRIACTPSFQRQSLQPPGGPPPLRWVCVQHTKRWIV